MKRVQKSIWQESSGGFTLLKLIIVMAGVVVVSTAGLVGFSMII